MAIETEVADRVEDQQNVSIRGLSEVQGKTDEEVFTQFCEDHLSVKPRPHSATALDVQQGTTPAVIDLISSSYLLRSPDSTQ